MENTVEILPPIPINSTDVKLLDRITSLETNILALEEKLQAQENPSQASVKDVFLDLADQTTFHGCPRIFKSDLPILKIFWTVFSLISTGGCFYFCYVSINIFMNYEYFITSKVVDAELIQFPVITFCYKIASLYWTPDKQYQDTVIRNILFNCQFNNHPCYFENFTKLKIFDEYYSTVRDCYAINIGGEHLRTGTYEKKGLTLSFILVDPIDSIQILMNPVGTNPKFIQPTEELNKYSKYMYRLKKIYLQKLGYPYNDCVDAASISAFYSDLYKTTMTRHGKYYRENCFDICLEQYITVLCNCSLTNASLTNCLETACYSQEALVFNTDTECSDQCPEECVTTSLKYTRKITSYPPPDSSAIKARLFRFLNVTEITGYELSAYFWDNFNYDYTGRSNDWLVRSLSIEVNLNYENAKYEILTEIPKLSLNDLIANIGGTFGLFLGISLLSFVEILDLLVKVFYMRVFRDTGVAK